MPSPDKLDERDFQPIVMRTKHRRDDGMDYHVYFVQMPEKESTSGSGREATI